MRSYTDKYFWNSYYKNYQLKEVGRVYFADLFDIFLKPDPAKTVFEVGCAGGSALCYLAKYFKFKAYGIDYSDEIEKTRALFKYNDLPSPILYQEDFFSWRSQEQYDVVCSFGFIEHFNDPRDIIARHVALLKPDGVLMITMPHFAHLQYILHWLIDRENLKKHNTKIMNIKAMQKALQGLPLEIKYLNYYRTFGFWTERKNLTWWERIINWKIQFFGRVINKLLGPHHPNPLFSPHLVLIARRQI
ncbi:MAG: class I SAM-dependent methyltransferase [Patescibacteria group bacterium]